MITRYLHYTIDPFQPAALERYSRLIPPPLRQPPAPHRDGLRPEGREGDLGASGAGAGVSDDPRCPGLSAATGS